MTPLVHLSASLWCLLLAGALVGGVVHVVLRVRGSRPAWEPWEL